MHDPLSRNLLFSIAFVFLAHLCMIAMMPRFSSLDQNKNSQKKVIVQTITLNERIQTTNAHSTQRAIQTGNKKTNQISPSIKKKKEHPTIKQKIVKPTETISSSSEKIKTTNQNKILLEKRQKFQESLDKINQSHATILASLQSEMASDHLPKQIDQLEIEALNSHPETQRTRGQEVSYEEQVGHQLKLALRLPEYGKVKINLTLNREGKVLKIQILSSESKKNQEYIELEIPRLVFPPFGKQFSGESDKSFFYTLTNDI
jgi:HSP20 family molecular chaperone IbpA